MEIQFDRGMISLGSDEGLPADLARNFTWDERTRSWRAPACHYREIVLGLTRAGTAFADRARNYQKLELLLQHALTPRSHQIHALKAWNDAGRRGVVQLPTGAGKTILAVFAILQVQRPVLVVVPTIDLLHQWQRVLREHLGVVVGGLGGGEKSLQPVTVATFNSASIFAETIGNQFGLLVVDECHHLPAPQNRLIALASIAPFRLGLSATVERGDGRDEDVYQLLGPKVFDGRIDEMISDVLAPYDVVSIHVAMKPEENLAYREARRVYLDFVRRAGVTFSRPDGWMDFVRKAARFPGGREAMAAFRDQKRLAQASSAKLDEVFRILLLHRKDRVIVFTDDNDMAYRIGREFYLPVLTHQTRPSERRRMLDAFRDGTIGVLATSKVLNEGVDVPDANVGIVVSGSSGVREHVQRLGRILRHQPGKRAVLYELLSSGTNEINVNHRRKQHHAYQRSAEVPR